MYLCIDTATEEAGVALADGKGGGHFFSLKTDHSSDGILPVIDRLFKKSKTTPQDLKGVLIVSGPGSFTSLRVGMAVANQFAHQLSIPIIPIRTDEWFRLRLTTPDFLYLQTMNREEVYAVGYGKLDAVFADRIVPFTQLLRQTGIVWSGRLSDIHLAQLPASFERLEPSSDLLASWTSVLSASVNFLKKRRHYELAEPYYGKEPTITKSKKGFKIQ